MDAAHFSSQAISLLSCQPAVTFICPCCSALIAHSDTSCCWRLWMQICMAISAVIGCIATIAPGYTVKSRRSPGCTESSDWQPPLLPSVLIVLPVPSIWERANEPVWPRLWLLVLVWVKTVVMWCIYFITYIDIISQQNWPPWDSSMGILIPYASCMMV